MSTRAEGPTAGAKAEVGTNPPMGIIEFIPGIPIIPRLLLKSSFSEKIVNRLKLSPGISNECSQSYERNILL